MILIPIVGVQPKPMRITAGAGLKIRTVGRRRVLYAPRSPAIFRGRFSVGFDAERGEVTIGVGRVNDLEPEIGGVPISGLYPDGTAYPGGPPRLSVGERACSICLKITPNPKTGRLDVGEDGMAAEGQLTVVTVTGPLTEGVGDSWYQTLARVSPYGFLAQFAYFNFWYQAYKGPGETGWRHLISLSDSALKTLDDLIREEKVDGTLDVGLVDDGGGTGL